jgi:hypothetical protein
MCLLAACCDTRALGLLLLIECKQRALGLAVAALTWLSSALLIKAR